MVVRHQEQHEFHFDQIKTKTVEALLIQLIHDVTNITETFPLERGQTYESLILVLESSIKNFLMTGDRAIASVPQIRRNAAEDLAKQLAVIEAAGRDMIYASRDFGRDLSSSQRRGTAVGSGRELLQEIARFLILADQVDVYLIIDQLDKVRAQLQSMQNVESSVEVVDRYQFLMAEVEILEETIRRRVIDLRDPQQRDNLLAAKGVLKTSCPLIYASSKAFVRHPENEESRVIREFSLGEANASTKAIEALLAGQIPRGSYSLSSEQLGHLISELDQFQSRVYMEPHTYRRGIHRPELEELLERIVSGSAAIADSPSTRDERKRRIVDECNNLRQALQDLLSEYEKICDRPSNSTEDVDLAMVLVGRKVKDVRRHLRRAVIDHLSDAFLDTRTPLLILIETAKTGDHAATEVAGHAFQEHAEKIIKVAHLACSMTSDVEGERIIRHTAQQLEKLAPQVVIAAHLLCSHPTSDAAKGNMEVFKNAWQEKVDLLTMAIDSVITLDDFLAVSEAHIVEDACAGLQAIHDGNDDMVDRAAGAIRGRSLRVCSVVDEEMKGLQANAYTERVKLATRKLRDEVLHFAARAEEVVKHTSAAANGAEMSPEDKNRDSDEFIDACTLVHQAMKAIRDALLINRNPEDVDSDNEYEDDGQTMVNDGASKISESENQQKLMRRLPEEDKKKIQEQIDVFKITQTKFEREVAMWDETGNDIIVLAKHMCMIMMNMTDFTRGRGPLKTTMDVIRAAQEISVAGSKLNALAKQIGDESVDSATKNDLFSYFPKITLYCQQLNICSRVKADVQQVGNELVVSGLDSAMSLIQTARNLLGAVVSTVKAAYISSTKYRQQNAMNAPRVEWNMAPPQKHPLVRPPRNNQGVVRRASERRPMPPAKALAEFMLP